MCGLPASGKTTTAARLHASLGGRLIRSCDVYADLGISLPDWVRRTKAFTERVDEYARLRDAAYVEMARRLDEGLTAGVTPVIVDAVHGEPDKRAAVYAASAPELQEVTGQCFDRRGRRIRTSRRSHDRAARERLWRMSSELTGAT